MACLVTRLSINLAFAIYLLFHISAALADNGIPIPAGTWTMVLTRGVPEESNGWEQLVYASGVKQSVMLSQYHQQYSEVNESLVGYNFVTNSWDVVDMGGLFHTENMPEGGESQGYFGYNPHNDTIVYYCCTTGSNQVENAFHTWWYDVLGQSGIDKHTSPKPPNTALQPAGTFDPAHNVFVFEGGDSFVGTWTYDPVANAWHKLTTNGTSPNPSLILAGMAYDTVDQRVYLFGGYDGTTYYSTLYAYDVPTNTWSLISPAGGRTPAGRFRHAFAYDSTNNVFLLYGGENGSGILGDTWVFNPTTRTWTELTPPQSPPIAASPVWARLAYDSDHNAFVLAQQGLNGYFGGSWTALSIQTWLFRYRGSGPNAGTLASTAAPAAGSINRNNTSWAKEATIASSGSALYAAWSETGSPFDPTGAALPNLYASQYSGGNWLPLGQSYQSINTQAESHAPSITLVGSTPWISWYQSNDSTATQVFAGSWNGSNWQTKAVGLAGTGVVYQGRSEINNVGGIPHVALLEVDKAYYPQEVLAYVRAWNGTSWPLKGTGPLNRNNVSGTTADSISIANDGTNPYVAWTEYVHAYGGSSGEDTDTNPQVYVSHWNGTRWVAVGNSLNVNTANWAYDATIAYFNGQPYVAWTERTQSGNAQVYVKAWNGSSWVPVGSGSLNRNVSTGWAYHPVLLADASSNSVYLGWVERGALGQKAQVYISRYKAGAWSALGQSLNIDSMNGSAQRVSMAVYNAQPVAAWGEVNMGWLRQIYVAQWNGSGWVQLTGTGGAPDTTPPTTPTNLSANAISSSRINLSWSPSSDLVGVVGYKVFRGSTQVGTVTSSFSYQDTGLSARTTYSYTVAACDAAGNISSRSLSASATTQGPTDTIPPTVSMTAPANGATVMGTTTISAQATDDVGVTGVQFQLDGVNLGGVVTGPGPSYSMSWNSTTARNGSHLLRAIATDVGGLSTTSASIAVTVSNSTGPPSLQILGNLGEVSGVSNGSVVKPNVAPSGFTGTVKVNGTGSVNYTAAQSGQGVYFLNCCSNTNNAYYKFTTASLGNIFNVNHGQITFYLKSRYDFFQRETIAASPRYSFDVRDGNNTHLFYFLTQVVSGQLQFTYAIGGSVQFYYVPQGTEKTVFGAGVILQVTLAWGSGTADLYVNNNLVKSTAYTVPITNWTSTSNFDLGAYEYLTAGGYNICDDVINAFTVR
jgi:hypothetical protein